MKVLVTLMGRSVWGLVNSLWSSVRFYEFIPKNVHIITTRSNLINAQIAADMVRVVLTNYGVEPTIALEIVDSGEVRDISSKAREIISRYGDGNEIALDVTSGTKNLVLGTALAVDRQNLKHLFYLHLDHLKNADRPFILIPMGIQHPKDVLWEVE